MNYRLVLPCIAAAMFAVAPAFAQVRLVSVSAAGVSGKSDSYNPNWHPSGCCVVFYTQATNIFASPPPNPTATQIAMVNLSTGVVTNMAPGVAVTTPDAINTYKYVPCKTPPIFSADGTQLVFYAEAANGIDPTDTGTYIDAFIENVTTGQITRMSAPNGIQGNGSSYSPLIAANGQTAAFVTLAHNLIPGLRYDGNALMIYNVASGAVRLGSLTQGGVPVKGGIDQPQFSPDGTEIVYGTNAPNLVPTPAGSTNIFIQSLSGAAPILVSQTASGVIGNGLSTHGRFSPDGTQVLFQTNSTSLGGNGVTLQVYVKNLQTGALTLISTDVNGVAGNGNSDHAEMSPDGTMVVMDTAATNFAAGTPTGSNQIAVKDLVTGTMSVVSVSPTGAPGTGNSNHPHWSPDGTMITFGSSSSNLVPGQVIHQQGVFVVPAPVTADAAARAAWLARPLAR